MIHKKSVQNPYELSFIMKQQLQRRITLIVVFIILTIFITIFVNTFLLSSFVAKSDTIYSVNPHTDSVFISPFIKPTNTILPSSLNIGHGDLVLVHTEKKLSLSPFKKIIKSCISFFTLNKIQLFTEHPSSITNASLLRVLAVPGDTIYIKDFILYIKNKDHPFFLSEFEISKKDYQIEKNVLGIENNHPLFFRLSEMSEITLAAGEYFVLSDNRLANLDSRLWGPISDSCIKGKALFRFKMFNDFSPL